jgi:hypothetical protein
LRELGWLQFTTLDFPQGDEQQRAAVSRAWRRWQQTELSLLRQESDCGSQSSLLNPALKIEIQLMVTTNAQPASPVKNISSTTYVAQSINR